MDISNQDVSMGIIDENVTQSIASSIGMVEAAEYAIKSGKVKKVIILEHAPRYDTEDKDPMGVCGLLPGLANNELKKARNSSEFAEHIMVGEHTGLVCAGSTRIQRFTSDHTHIRNKSVRLGKYDGIHMYSQAGAKALTQSLLNTLLKAGMVRRPEQWGLVANSSSTSPQEEWSFLSTARGFKSNSWNPNNRRHNNAFHLPLKNRYIVQNFW